MNEDHPPNDEAAGNATSTVAPEHRLLDALHRVWVALDHPGDEAATLELIHGTLAAVRAAVGAEAGSVLVRDDSGAGLVFVVVQGVPASEHLLWQVLPRGTGIAQWVAEQRRSTIVNDVAEDSRFFPNFDNQIDFRTRSVMSAPVVWRDQLVGVSEVLNKAGGEPFTQADERRLVLASGLLGGVLTRLLESLEDRPPSGRV